LNGGFVQGDILIYVGHFLQKMSAFCKIYEVKREMYDNFHKDKIVRKYQKWISHFKQKGVFYGYRHTQL
jgi:hypothetical protein